VDRIEARGIGRTFGVVLVFLCVFGLAVLSLLFAIPMLLSSSTD
jgi:predicted PurR-regulated permease PerM